jgi:hypothetical protein
MGFHKEILRILLMLCRPTLIGTLLIALALNSPVKAAETCVPISLVGGQGNQVTKTVSQPTVPSVFGVDITRNNWNTDWAVSSDRPFKKFVATISSPNGGSFDIQMYLKYSDQTTGQFFNQQDVRIDPGKPLTITATPEPNDEPYQVNLFIGGVNHFGKTYTATVVGCY